MHSFYLRQQGMPLLVMIYSAGQYWNNSLVATRLLVAAAAVPLLKKKERHLLCDI